ncbi:endolytic transglycosylase MltG [Anaerobacillus isosaccharinicus]|uniref:Endolytic transglycosylase MltG n=1 Tax=Anaerobacillus isosaccharinicus TaxID=1532552 RepID=A0A1S2LRW2_9BACI|nr:endolytic transglycosylase MltG [Anaerobacillus isosaccharinicus]MBA5585544.1 endolytic transglycosylase MltG [Anaerobacillus isosaccharinicus]QOY36142.1 endolytic transglycosylase MltG [Anaerobacillus isosaccharinicus]
MTKKMLQGIATGILLTTLLLAYNFYFTDNFLVIKEKPSEEKMNFTEQDLEDYLQDHGLVAIDKLEYEQLLEGNLASEEVIESAPSSPEKVIERVVVKEITFTIEPGMSSGSVAQSLEESGLIADRSVFEEYVSRNGLETKIKAGVYSLTSDMSLEDILKTIT